MELVNRVAKVTGQENANGDSMCDEHIVLSTAGFEASPERVEEGRDSVEL